MSVFHLIAFLLTLQPGFCVGWRKSSSLHIYIKCFLSHLFTHGFRSIKAYNIGTMPPERLSKNMPVLNALNMSMVGEVN